jgi:hypothetical protein
MIENDILYPNDPRTFVTFDHCGKTIYHAYNVLTRKDREGLLEEIDDELSTTVDKWDMSVEATNVLPRRKLKNKECWVNFFKMVKYHFYNYAKVTKNPKLLELKIESYWAKRMKGVSEEKYAEELYLNYGNFHSHDNFDLGMIYYLQNPSRIYGTLINNEDREIIIPGDENSLLIHHSNVGHQPVHPPPVIAKNYYRCVLVVDFMHPEKLKLLY